MGDVEEKVRIAMEARDAASASVKGLTEKFSNLTRALSSTGSAARELRLSEAVTGMTEAGTAAQGLSGTLGVLASPGGIIALAVAGLASLATVGVLAAKSLSDVVIQLERTAARTGVAAENIQVLSHIIEAGGGDAGVLNMALSLLNRSIAQGDPMLKKLGITTHDTFTAFMELARILGDTQDQAKATEVAYQLMGRGAGALLPFNKAISQSFEETSTMMKRNGSLISAQIEPANRLHHSIVELEDKWKGLSVTLQTLAIPSATLIIKWLNEEFGLLIVLPKAVEAVTLALKKFSKASAEAKPAGPSAAKEAQLFSESTAMWLGQVAKAVEAVGKSAKKAGSVIDDMDLTNKKEPTEREKHIAELARLLGVSTSKAETLLRVLEKVDDKRKREAILKSLADPEVPTLPGTGGTLEKARTETDKALDRLEHSPMVILDNFKKAMREALRFGNIIRQSLETVLNSLASGINTVLSGLFQHTQTIGQAIVTIMKSVLDSIIQIISQILAHLAIAGLIKLASALLTGGIGNIGTVVDTVGSARAGSARGGEGGALVAAPSITNVYALDVQSFITAKRSPFGGDRRANKRIRIRQDI